MTYTTDYRKTYPNGAYTIVYPALGDVEAFTPGGRLLGTWRTSISGNVGRAEEVANAWRPEPETFTGDSTQWPVGIYQMNCNLHSSERIYVGGKGSVVRLGSGGFPLNYELTYTELAWIKETS